MQTKTSLYAQASEAIQRKDRLTARKLLDELIFHEPNNEQAWLLLAEAVEHLNEKTDCLQHALAINPQNQVTRQKYDELLRRHPKLVELDPVKGPAAAAASAAAKAAAKAEKARQRQAAKKAAAEASVTTKRANDSKKR